MAQNPLEYPTFLISEYRFLDIELAGGADLTHRVAAEQRAVRAQRIRQGGSGKLGDVRADARGKRCLLYTSFAFLGQTLVYLIMIICIANTVEYNEWKTGRREEGIVFSVRPFISKQMCIRDRP